MLFLELFHGRKPKDQPLEDWGDDGPIFKIDFYHTTYARHLRIDDSNELFIDDDMLYYGMWYGDWSVFSKDQLPEEMSHRLAKFEKSKSRPTLEKVCPDAGPR